MKRSTSAVAALAFGSFAFAAATAQAGKYNDVLSVGDPAPAFEDLAGVDGEKVSLDDFDEPVVVVVFTCNSCPVATDYEARIEALSKRYPGKVAVVAINSNKVPDDSFANMQRRAKEQEYSYPYLHDETQEVATKFGAYATPEFYVLSPERKIVYMGAMDDSSTEAKVEKRYVEDAIAAALAGKAPETTETFAHGCRIRYERPRRR